QHSPAIVQDLRLDRAPKSHSLRVDRAGQPPVNEGSDERASRGIWTAVNVQRADGEAVHSLSGREKPAIACIACDGPEHLLLDLIGCQIPKIVARDVKSDLAAVIACADDEQHLILPGE